MVNGIELGARRQNAFWNSDGFRDIWHNLSYNKPIKAENSVFENVANSIMYNVVTLRPEEGLTGLEKLAAKFHNIGVATFNPVACVEYMSHGMSTRPKALNAYNVRQLSDGRISLNVTNGNYGARVYTPQEYQAWVNKA